jgi:hypothetical protein
LCITSHAGGAATRPGKADKKLKIPDEMRVIIDALWEFSTERQDGDPSVVKRKGSNCKATVDDDVNLGGLICAAKSMLAATQSIEYTSRGRCIQDFSGVPTFARHVFQQKIPPSSRCR